MARSDATRSRILDEARNFANEVGFDRLTTRELAARCGINEGNLYYYFKTKSRIVEALFSMFERDARALFALSRVPDTAGSATETDIGPSAAIGLLHAWCRLSWHYRALLRDGNAIFRLAPGTQTPAISLNTDLAAQVGSLLRDLRRQGALSIAEDAIPALVANIFIVSTHWIGYVLHQTGVSDPDETHLEWGFGQILALVGPYLTQQA